MTTLQYLLLCASCAVVGFVGARIYKHVQEMPKDPPVTYSKNIDFSEDQVLVCTYLSKERDIQCSTVEEFLEATDSIGW